MLLTVSTTHRPATDLGFLLHKNRRFAGFEAAVLMEAVEHGDHRFEWTRDGDLGTPTRQAVFTRGEGTDG